MAETEPTTPPPKSRRRERAAERLSFRLVDAAAVVGVSTSYLGDEIAQGRIEARRAGRAILVPAEALRRWLDNLPPAA